MRPLYALEDAAALCGVYCAVRISLYLFLPDSEHQRLNRLIQNAAATFSLGMCGVGVLVPLLVLPSFPGFMLWYGPLISGYQILAALFLIAAAACGCVLGKPYSRPALMAVTANGVCLLYGAVTVGRFEPAFGGWPEEYGAFCMVLAFAALMVSRSRAMAAENLRLTEHLQEEVDEKTRHLTKLLKERGQLMAELGHDMKSPLTALSNMAQIIRLNDIMLDGNTREKMQGIEDKCSVLADRLESIQELAGETGALPQMEPLSLNRFLADFYRSNQPVVELTGPDFLCELTPLPCTVMADSRKLTRALENLVYNAIDFTPAEGEITLLTFFAFMILVSRVYDPLTAALDNLSAIIMMKNIQCKRMDEILSHPEQKGTDKLTNKGYDITFDHVGFSYNSGETVLRDISFTARQGEVTALVGPSGGGKTTLCNLIPRFYDVTGGEITIDGKSIKHFTLKSLRHNIGIVQQDVYLFAGTIYDNIVYGRPDATREEVMEAAKRAGAHEFITELKDGYDTYVGERGVKLSGGQKQRISIARVFLKNPPIIILDEATSALDNESEYEVAKSLGRLSEGRTTLTIAHRLSSIRNSDRILVLTHDGIVEEGNHEELLEKHGIYDQFYRMANELK